MRSNLILRSSKRLRVSNASLSEKGKDDKHGAHLVKWHWTFSIKSLRQTRLGFHTMLWNIVSHNRPEEEGS
jgi:hypothetical protein